MSATLSFLTYPIQPDPVAPPTSAATLPMTSVSYGSPIWVFILVAVIAAIVSAALTLLAIRQARRSGRVAALAV
jgi:hypothetical protein